MECCGNNYLRKEETKISEPDQVAYLEHPKTHKRFNVLYTQNEYFEVNKNQYLVCVYYLEENNKAFYCEHYEGGNWIWESK